MIEASPQESLESKKRDLVARNFQKMTSKMLDLLGTESVGGNAGGVTIGDKDYACVAANAYVDSESGEIKVFGNYQSVPEEIREKNKHVTFRLAVNFGTEGRKGFFRIVEVLDIEDLDLFAQEVINASVAEYNRLDIVKTVKL